MKTVVIFGGSGFLGRYIIRRLAKKAYKIIVPYQQPSNLAKLRILGNIGQIIPIKFSKLDDELIRFLIKNSSYIINLKTLWDEKNTTYEEGIYNFNKKLVKIINSVNRFVPFVFFSGLGVTNSSFSKRIKFIYDTEEYISKNMLNSVILKPGIVLGGNDQFLKKIVPIIKLFPAIPLFGSGNSKIQPVYVDDVAKAVETILESYGPEENLKQTFELTGPNTYTYKSLYLYISNCLGLRRAFFPFPIFIAGIIMAIFDKIGLKIVTKEQLKLFKNDNLPSNKYLNFNKLNIHPKDLNEIIKISLKKLS